ncbi:hypothetical protein D9757_007100 [Collybiopsis confluens]|uniref:Uncharacterized protein n=1 Tax=Collybiopsis confluens TaxID=2823264 RepID=A0A8H5M4U5_9AGAR|nr:hypothetical protein D9757_007100 [Collybiopsis confluens]
MAGTLLAQLFAVFVFVVLPSNAVTFTLPDPVVLNQSATIKFVKDSTDPPVWILRNVYANGTTQIGGILSGTGSTTFEFRVAGPHFLQALLYNETTSSANSEPFYTGSLFIPVDLTATSSATSISATATFACPSQSATAASGVTNSSSCVTGAIVGGVVGGLGFLSALVFLGLWLGLRQEYKRKPTFGQAIKEENAAASNSGTPAVHPLVPTPFDHPAPAARSVNPGGFSSGSTAGGSSASSNDGGQMKPRHLETRRASISTMPAASTPPTTLSPLSQGPSFVNSQPMEDTTSVAREISQLRSEVRRLRQEANQMNEPPPSY